MEERIQRLFGRYGITKTEFKQISYGILTAVAEFYLATTEFCYRNGN